MLPNLIYPTITIKINDWVIGLGNSFTQQIDQKNCPTFTQSRPIWATFVGQY